MARLRCAKSQKPRHQESGGLTLEHVMRFSAALSICLLLIASNAVLAADDAAFKRNVRDKVLEINDAVIKSDVAKILDLTYPKVVEAMGGREKAIAEMTDSLKRLKAQGFEFIDSKVDEPSDSVKAGDDLFVVVTFEMKIKVPSGGKLRQKSFVIGISPDAGKTWKFVNGDMDIKVVKTMVPNLPDSLKLPARQKAVVEKE
jgi:hypothetical protein